MSIPGLGSRRKVAAKGDHGNSAQVEDAKQLLGQIEKKQAHADSCVFC